MEFLKNEMVHRGLECNYSVEPGMGHGYPHNFDRKLAETLDFILRDTCK